MSLHHQNQTNIESEDEEHQKQKNEIYNYQIENMYNKEKYVNPHDIAGTKGLVKAQNDELNIKKVKSLNEYKKK